MGKREWVARFGAASSCDLKKGLQTVVLIFTDLDLIIIIDCLLCYSPEHILDPVLAAGATSEWSDQPIAVTTGWDPNSSRLAQETIPLCNTRTDKNNLTLLASIDKVIVCGCFMF